MAFENKPLTFDTSEVKKYASDFTKTVVDRIVKLVSSELTRDTKIESPVDEGFLRSSIQFPNKIKALVYAIKIKAIYWRAIQFGRKAIRPVNKKVLRFEIKGKIIFAKFAKATKPNPFITRAIDRTGERLIEFAIQAVAESKK